MEGVGERLREGFEGTKGSKVGTEGGGEVGDL